MGAMAAQSPQANDLTTLTLDAVRALLREIAISTHQAPGGGNASHPNGTYASFAAQALRDLLASPSISQIVQGAVVTELQGGSLG